MPCHYDHIDLRVPHLPEVTPFYELLLPHLGFNRRIPVEGWLQFEAEDYENDVFFGVTESPNHVANENRIAFRALHLRTPEVPLAKGGRICRDCQPWTSTSPRPRCFSLP